MANLNGFNAHDVDPNTGFDPIPAGNYLAAITASEMKPTKNGQGSYLELTFTVLEGEYQGRTLWARLNLNNPNATAVKIARGELSAICHAVGVMQPRDSVELHNLPLVINVKVKKRSDNDELINEIKGFEAKSAPGGRAQATASTGVSSGGGTQAPATDNTPPWKR
jgi:hypothetical protein